MILTTPTTNNIHPSSKTTKMSRNLNALKLSMWVLLGLIRPSGTLSAQWDTTMHLPTARRDMSSVYAGGKAFFAGGRNTMYQKSDVVDILEVATGQWPSAQLSVPRSEMAAVNVGDKVLFVGGLK
jgi:hypothetical protein